MCLHRMQAERRSVDVCVEVIIALVFVLLIQADGDETKGEEHDRNCSRRKMYSEDEKRLAKK